MAVATATGTPIKSASTEVISVPTISGSAPKCSALTFQWLPEHEAEDAFLFKRRAGFADQFE